MSFLTLITIEKEFKQKRINKIKRKIDKNKKIYNITMYKIKVKNVNAKKQNKTIKKLLKLNETFHKNLKRTKTI